MAFSWLRKSRRAPQDAFDVGWQFYPRPTTLEPVGSVFRIMPDGTRFQYGTLAGIEVQRGPEAARLQKRVGTSVNGVARFLSLKNVGGSVGGNRVETLEFELVSPIREVITDAALKGVLSQFLRTMEYSRASRYFLIRETLSCSAMTYRLSKEVLAELGGEASLSPALAANATLKGTQEGLHEVSLKFPQRMRVTFLAQEIKPISAGLGGGTPELGLVEVDEVLQWQD